MPHIIGVPGLTRSKEPLVRENQVAVECKLCPAFFQCPECRPYSLPERCTSGLVIAALRMPVRAVEVIAELLVKVWQRP
jgi:hypothetical protein